MEKEAELTAEAAERLINDDVCPECGKDLDTGYECNGCGKDWLPTVDKLLGTSRGSEPTPKRRAAVLWHADADGFGSAFAAWHALKDSHDLIFKPVQYGEPIPYQELRAFAPEQVYILDFSYKAPDLREMMNEFNVVVIDHHDGVVPELAGFAEIHIVSQEPTPCPCGGEVVSADTADKGACVGKCPPPPMPILSGVRVIPGTAGCVLSWLFFNPGQDIPEILLYVQDRDLWKWELEHSKEINAYIGTLPFEFDVWADFYTPLAYDAGKAVLAFQQRQVESRLKGVGMMHCHIDDGVALRPATPESLVVNGMDLQPHLWCVSPEASISSTDCAKHLIPITNATENISEVGEALCLAYPEAPFSITYCDRPGGMRSYSLRSRNGFDVSEVARAFGGNGHKAAAGFTLPSPAKI